MERAPITTAFVYFREAFYVCEGLKVTLKELVTMDTKQAKFFLQDLIIHFEKKGIKGSGIEGYVKSVKS